MKKFFKKSNGVWVLGKYDGIPAGQFIRKIDSNEGMISIFQFCNMNVAIVQGHYKDFTDSMGLAYDSLEALISATDEFFLAGSGSVPPVDLAHYTLTPLSAAYAQAQLLFDQGDSVAKVGLAADFFAQMPSALITVGFNAVKGNLTAKDFAIAYMSQNGIQGTWPNYTPDFPNTLVAMGADLPCPLNQAAASTVAGTVLFTWTDNSDDVGADGTDQAILVVYNPEKRRTCFFRGLGTRADGTQAVTVPHSFSGDLVHCYVAFEKADQSEVSFSNYAGAITVA